MSAKTNLTPKLSFNPRALTVFCLLHANLLLDIGNQLSEGFYKKCNKALAWACFIENQTLSINSQVLF